MADYRKLKPFILRWEGGYINDQADLGKQTNKGVTLSTYRSVFGKNKTVSDLKKITDEQWEFIFKKYYWNRWKADDIKSQKVANILVDWVWGSGSHGIKIPQTLLGVVADGIVGSKTIAAVNNANPDKLFDSIYKARETFLRNLADKSVAAYEKKIGRKATEKELLKYTQKRFLKGWLNRLADIKNIK